ncbi:hypothetical protein K504DRAFT_462301 [Pleomassaria siparia CBS 279.74]|uniref:Uncharacterized protein n=1 Tax=Pleomassaria siparia CBS 279.74 TaxID=1314801 RepID=A0A6G1KLV7_9PLEO|nr:hypothetical protein K504DRAFT_462301 [Pleomassaria siparia CBS 279.74]
MPPVRTLSRRNVRGRGWHKKGYREGGNLFFQLKRTYANFSRTHEVNENETITNLILSMHGDIMGEDPGSLPEDLHYEFHFRRNCLYPSDDMVKTIMDGGETVYAKVFDDERNEYIYEDCEWYAKPKRGRAQ